MLAYALAGVTAVALALGGYSLYLRNDLSHTRLALQEAGEHIVILITEQDRTRQALQKESASRARIERESREWRARLERTQDPDWLEWREQPLPKVLTERYGQ
jgi:hypothetical protein